MEVTSSIPTRSYFFSRASAKAECDLSNLYGMYVELEDPPEMAYPLGIP